MIKVEGPVGIYAKVLADSISPQGVRLLTFEISYPRIVHAELMTHCMLAKNAASSRAIPFEKMKEQLTGRPVRFGQANPGMQDKGEDYEALVCIDWPTGETHPRMMPAKEAWDLAKRVALRFSSAFYQSGYHKQVYNRLTETFQMMKTVITGTEFGNFFWLRDHDAADPTIAALARCMREARKQSKPKLLQPGEWHLPYVDFIRGNDGRIIYGDFVPHVAPGITVAFQQFVQEGSGLEEAIKVSGARTASVSFRNVDYGVEKSEQVFERLVGDDRKHGSAMEHQATPMAEEKFTGCAYYHENVPAFPKSWQEGISHVDRQGQLWSGKLRGWISYRKLIPGENYVDNGFDAEEE